MESSARCWLWGDLDRCLRGDVERIVVWCLEGRVGLEWRLVLVNLDCDLSDDCI